MKKLLLIAIVFTGTFFADAQETCMDFNSISMTANQINALQAGSTFHTEGNMKLVTSAGIGWPSATWILGIGNTIDYMGWIDVDVSAETCKQKKLTVGGSIQDIAIDDDTLKLVNTAAMPYSGPNYVINKVNNEFVITGDFSTVKLGGQTNQLTKVCLDNTACLSTSTSTASQTKHKLFPNPNNGNFTLQVGNQLASVKIYNALGAVVYAQSTFLKIGQINITNLPNGVYFTEIVQGGNRSWIKFHKK